ncbi:MFS transporter [Actinomadura sp. NEAU-AAG7]|uniref:MFS transporter n=1 Tax=Actinomadura sp. NEAU-AAG7 TaxID=2839640 RepID=UPI001BE4AFA2|nr:MFS transporter [Actinomadura sp. NEAU-AAG7]MBT2212480.1 MFS transporter [Actinomadura sp. NEAU-AAG7]
MSVSPSSPSVTTRPPGAARRGDRPGIALAVIVACQLMIVLDGTIVNIALPDIQRGLEFSETGKAWIITAYTLTFGGLLLLGGRIGDVLGRRHVFVAGIAVFTVASLLGGLATTGELLLAARVGQGAGAALAGPSTLALIVTNFPEEAERNKAMGIYSAIAGSGLVIGLILGGALTSGGSWRWVMFINVPIGVAIVLLAPLFVNEPPRHSGRFDVAGAVTSTVGMVALVYGFTRVAEKDWGDRVALGSFAVAVAALALFLVVEARAKQPVMPYRLLRDRDRAAAYLNMLLLPATLMGLFFFITQLLQTGYGYSAIEAGLAFLPMAVLQIVTARNSAALLAKFGPKPLMLTGAVGVFIGMAWLSRLSDGGGYATEVLGPLILVGAGMGLCFMPMSVTILSSVSPRDSGAASGLLQTMQQVGASLGVAVLVTVYGEAVRDEAKHPVAGASPQDQAHHLLTHGIATGFLSATVIVVIAFLVLLFGFRGTPAAKAKKDD